MLEVVRRIAGIALHISLLVLLPPLLAGLIVKIKAWFAGRRGRRTTDLLSGGFLVAIGLSSGWTAL